MAISVFDLFSIGIGPSSSHTVGPMRAVHRFLTELENAGLMARAERFRLELYGSLALTGKGHGTDRALILGMAGKTPETLDPDEAEPLVRQVHEAKRVALAGARDIPFDPAEDIVFHRNQILPRHPNGLSFFAFDRAGAQLLNRTYFSIGGGFLLEEGQENVVNVAEVAVPYEFTSATELLDLCKKEKLRISDVILANERARHSDEEIRNRLNLIWATMQDCVKRGCRNKGTLPGGLKVRRRAPMIFEELTSRPESSLRDPLTILDWVNLYALAVNEENASGGRVVTAPTNGAAGILPAVIHYYDRFCMGASTEGIHRFLLTAAAIGMLFKMNASISGAEVGCQGEVGVACSMAAGGLTEALGGTIQQVENAAEIAMEHNLGLTCDPVGGLVQIPCIERNAMGSIKAINASRLALRGDGSHSVSLDQVIVTMRQTGADMSAKYKETSRGGLAVNFPEC